MTDVNERTTARSARKGTAGSTKIGAHQLKSASKQRMARIAHKKTEERKAINARETYGALY